MISMPDKKERAAALYSIAETCEILKVSDETVRRMIKSKELDAVKVRGQWRIRSESINKYLGR